MLDFRDIDITDRDWITQCLKKSDFMGCEYSFANNMAWRRLSDSKITRFKDFYICGTPFNEQPYFVFPSGSGDYREVIGELKKFCEDRNKPLILTGVTERQLEQLGQLYPDKSFSFEYDEDGSDYIYNVSDLAELAGKKYHQKRGHLKKFMLYNPQYSEITESDFDDCIAFSADLYNTKNGIEDRSSVSEQFAIDTYFRYFRELDLKGGIIRVDGKIVAFTIGEMLNTNTFCVHIEKADTAYNGSFTALNNEFVKNTVSRFGECRYVNREEDLGIEGLRKAKRSYYPVFMLKKHIVTFR